MIKSVGDNYRIYGLIIVKTTKKSLMIDYGLSNATCEPNHVFAYGESEFDQNVLIFHNNFRIEYEQHLEDTMEANVL
jgi:hypothetical protein